MATVWALVVDAWNWSAFFGVMAFVTYLSAPRERPPTYGLDHDIPADDPAFLDSVVGLTGIAFLEGNQVVLLNNGDEFYPAMLEAIGEAQESITIEAYIYWAGDDRPGVRACAGGERRSAGVTVKILLDAVGSGQHRRRDPEDARSAAAVSSPWFNPIRWYSIGRFNHRTHRKSLIIDGRDRVHRRRRHRRPLARATRRIRSTGATCRSGSRARR